MSRRAYDDYDRQVAQAPPPRPRSRGSNYATGPPGGFPESPNDAYPRTSYPAPIPMPHAPAPPDDAYSSSQPSGTIVSGRRPPSPGVRFADEPPARARSQSRGPPQQRRDNGNPARSSASGTDWARVYERELAEQRQLEKERVASAAREANSGPTSRGLDVNLNTDRVKSSLTIGRKKEKEKRENDLAWSSEDSEDEKERERERDKKRRDREREREQREREREAEARRRNPQYAAAAEPYGDPRRSAGQLVDPRRSAGALALVNERERERERELERERQREREIQIQLQIQRDKERAERERIERDRIERDRLERERLERERIDLERERERAEKANRRRSTHYEEAYYGDPRRSAGQLGGDPRRSAGALVSTYGEDPRKSGGHLVRYENKDQYYRRESPPRSEEISGVRYVQRPLSPTGSGRTSSTHYLVTESSGGRQRARSVGHREAPSLNTDVARMTIHDRDYYDRDRYDEFTPDGYRPSYYTISPLPSPRMGPGDRGFNFDVGGSFALGTPLGSASAGYSAGASSSGGHHHRRHRSSSRSRRKGTPIIPEEKKRRSDPPYDPSDHAQILYKALKGKVADVSAVVKVIPLLSGEQIISLRAEYKKVHPMGNVNLAKHLKAQLSGKVQQAAYVTALGPYESESFWATLSTQKPNFRHALLIEALMGRENDDILDIKDSYRDSKNDNNFEKAITKELNADKATGEKFKELVLMQLDARGMNEWDKVYPDDVHDDVEDLHDALAKDKVDSLFVGKIVITRSTTHLREMMRLYKHLFNQDLARLIAEKITGLVGEALLHVLNGVLNKPARDARLLEESMKGVGTRDDLLVARLTRIHWDPEHLTLVKEAYKAKYGMTLKDRIKGECSGSYQEFLINMISVDTHTTAVLKK